MRVPTDMGGTGSPRSAHRTRRVGIGLALGLLLVLGLSLRGLARFYTDYLWFDSLDLSGVWSKVLVAKVVLGVAFTLLFFVVLWGNLAIADMVAPEGSLSGAEGDLASHYRRLVERRASSLRLGVAAAFALVAGPGASSQWRQWVLFRNRVAFGRTDALFDHDLGFYVFQLPFLDFLTGWLFDALVVITVLTALAHLLNGGIRLQGRGDKVSPQVKAHLSVLLAALAVLKALDYLLQRYALAYGGSGVVEGAGYTDVTARLPALQLLVVISLFAAVLLLVNLRRRGWVLPGIAFGLWALVAVVVGVAIPAFVQHFRVAPTESARERPYIARNIEATLEAYDLGNVAVEPFAASDELTAADLEANAATVRNVRLWDPEVLARTYEREQAIRNYFRFNDVDVDRYVTESGADTQMLLALRELDTEGIPSSSWVSRHLVYTHGYGAVVSPSNGVTADGNPSLRVRDLPPVGTPTIERPAVYFGQDLPGYAIVNTGQAEVDFTGPDGANRTSTYGGTGGVRTSSWLRRAALALRFGDTNPLISDFVTADSRALYVRDIDERVRKAAPFLSYDSDPYPVILEGRIVWVYDAYTTTDRYPYAAMAEVDRLPAGSGLDHRFNYVRNSVKVVIDAYDGSMNFYVVDRGDPLVRAYDRAFPGLFTTGEEMPPELRRHLRYPEDLFKVQTDLYGQYHLRDPAAFYDRTDAWQTAQEPGPVGSAAPATVIGPDGVPVPVREARMEPQYLLMRPPGADEEDFLILQAFVPLSGDDVLKNMTAFMVARSDPEHYGELSVYEMPRDRQVDGPGLVNARINQDAEVSREITLLDQRGSDVTLGNMLMVPMDQSLLWVRPLYVEASGGTPLPQLTYVIVVHGDQVVMRPSLRDALVELFGASPPTLEQRSGEPGLDGGSDGALGQALAEADAHFRAAEEALRAGDLARYQGEVEAAAEAVRRAQALAAEPTPDANAERQPSVAT